MTIFTSLNREWLEIARSRQADGMAICSEDLSIVLSNRAFSQITGFKKKELLETNLLEYVLFDRESLRIELIRSYKENDDIHIKDVKIITASGNVIRTDVWLKRITPSQGECSFLFYFKKDDRTGGRKFGVADMIHSIHESLIEAIFRVSAANEIVYANNAMMSMFGYHSFAEMALTPYRNHFADPPINILLNEKILAEGRLKDERVLFTRNDHSHFWGLLSCVPRQINGELFYDGIIIDISEQIKKETLLRERAESIEKINRELDRFVYSASHDIRSPISSMMGIINLIKMDGAFNTQYVDMLEGCIMKLESFTRDLTSFFQNKRQFVNTELIDFEKVVAGALKHMESHKYFKSVKITRKYGSTGVFFSDAFRIQLILEQVVKNAYDFHDNSKPDPAIEISVQLLSNKAIIEVIDNGTGIAKVHQDKVFNLFYRASNLSGGSGIGLYIAQETVALLEGTIHVYSEYTIGTRVRIEMPDSSRR